VVQPLTFALSLGNTILLFSAEIVHKVQLSQAIDASIEVEKYKAKDEIIVLVRGSHSHWCSFGE
jgi:hypothetical protein